MLVCVFAAGHSPSSSPDLPATHPTRARARNHGSHGRPSSAGPCPSTTCQFQENESSALSFLSIFVIWWKQLSQKPTAYRSDICTEGFAIIRCLMDTRSLPSHIKPCNTPATKASALKKAAARWFPCARRAEHQHSGLTQCQSQKRVRV